MTLLYIATRSIRIGALIIGGYWCCESIAQDNAIEIGLSKQLVVDDFAIASTTNVSRQLGEITKGNGNRPLVFTRQLESGGTAPIDVWPLFATVLYDSALQKFRMWHRVSFADRSQHEAENVTSEEVGVGTEYQRGYSESQDGIHFQLISLLKGITTGGDTNLVVTIDSHDSDPGHRYKIGYDCKCEVNGAALAHSANGIDWTPYNHGQPITGRAADFTNQVYWEPQKGAYRLVTRTDFGWGGGPLAGSVDVMVDGHPLEVRGVRSMINPDLKSKPTDWTIEQHWFLDGEKQLSKDRPPIEELLQDPAYVQRARQEALRRQVYVMTDWFYEGVYFGLLSVLEWPTDVSEGLETDHITRHERSVENFYITTSRDGIGWDLHWVYAGQPFVPRGADGAWDKDMIFPSSQVITHQDKHWIYYGGTNERHGSAEKNVWFKREGSLGLAWLRLDGFVAIAADGEAGEIITKPFRLDGKHLELNVDAKNNGSVRVEIADEMGQPIVGFSGESAEWSDSVDQVHFQPAWNDQADLSTLQGRTVQLKIQLKNARLYAFQVCP